MLDGGGQIVAAQMMEAGAVDGIEIVAEKLLEAVHLLDDAEETATLLQEKMAVEQQLAYMDMELLALMQAVDGAPVAAGGFVVDKNGNYDFANIKSTDIALFNDHLNKLLAGKTVLLPKFDFIKGKKVFQDSYLTLNENDVLIIEGIHTLNDLVTKNVSKENKFKIYISPLVALKIDNHNRVHTTDVRKLRRIVRDNQFRGNKAEDTLKMWPNVDKEAMENIYPYQDSADAIINSALTYEMGVLRVFAEPLLYSIKTDSEVYPEAVRLINLLRNFMPISSEIVPKDSLLREFIGGGIYN